jgi:hypothetical protein
VLVNKAAYPIAVLSVPVVLEHKAASPIAVLDAPVVLENKAAVLDSPKARFLLLCWMLKPIAVY